MQLTLPGGTDRDTLYSESLLARFADKTILRGIAPRETRCHLIARRTLQGGGTAVGFLGRAPLIEMNLQLAAPNVAYGIALSAGSCTSFGYLVAFAFLEIIEDQLRPKTEEERALVESRLSSAAKRTYFVGALVLGFGSQVPFAWLSYKYNPASSWNPHRLGMPIMTLAIDSWVSVYSAQRGLRELHARCTLPEALEGLSQVRGNMHALVEENMNLLTLVTDAERSGFLAAYQALRSIEDAPDRAARLYELFATRLSDHTHKPPPYAARLAAIVKAYGYLCSACNIGTLGYVAWSGSDDLTGAVAANIFFTGLYVGTALYLNLKVIPTTAAGLFHKIRSLFTCSYVPTMADRLTPALSFCLKAINMVLVSLSFGMAVKISKDYYGFSDPLEIFMEITLSSATIFLMSMAVLNITDRLLEEKVLHFGTDEEKLLMELYQKMRHLSSVIARSPVLEVARYFNLCSSAMQQQLLQNTRLTTETIRLLLDAHRPSPHAGSRLLPLGAHAEEA